MGCNRGLGIYHRRRKASSSGAVASTAAVAVPLMGRSGRSVGPYLPPQTKGSTYFSRNQRTGCSSASPLHLLRESSNMKCTPVRVVAIRVPENAACSRLDLRTERSRNAPNRTVSWRSCLSVGTGPMGEEKNWESVRGRSEESLWGTHQRDGERKRRSTGAHRRPAERCAPSPSTPCDDVGMVYGGGEMPRSTQEGGARGRL